MDLTATRGGGGGEVKWSSVRVVVLGGSGMRGPVGFIRSPLDGQEWACGEP